MSEKVRVCALVLVLLSGVAGQVSSGQVLNVRAAQRPGTELVDIFYDLAGSESPEEIIIEISSDDGATYTVPNSSIFGAVGTGIEPGFNLFAVWNARADWNGHYSPAVRFKVSTSSVTNAPPPAPAGMSLVPGGLTGIGDPHREPYYDSVESTPEGYVYNPKWPPEGHLFFHRVYVSPFYIERLEVTLNLFSTVHEYAQFNGYPGDLIVGVGPTQVYYPYDPFDFPVYDVTWSQAVLWCNARSEMEGLTPCYYKDGSVLRDWPAGGEPITCEWNADGYRLPTEAEWEKAARLNGSARFPWGNTISHDQATYQSRWKSDYNRYGFENDGPIYYYDVNTDWGPHRYWLEETGIGLAPGGSFSPSRYGLYDMAGNVAEWCWDVFSDTYYAHSPLIDPKGPGGNGSHVTRGGDGYSSARECTVWERLQSDRFRYLGFRCVRRAPYGASASISSSTTVDTMGLEPGGDPPPLATVTGRVLYRSDTPPPLAGATLSLQGRTVETDWQGNFSFANIDLTGALTLLAHRDGYLDQTIDVNASVGKKAVDVGDISLEPVTTLPVIESLTPSTAGLFLPGFGLEFIATAKVNWNGNVPGYVDFYANFKKIATEPGQSGVSTHTYRIDDVFAAAFGLGKNTMSVIARPLADGPSSEIYTKDIVVIPMPLPFAGLVTDSSMIKEDIRIEINITVPDPPIEKSLYVPLVGPIAAKVQNSVAFVYSVETGEWSLQISRQGKAVEIKLGDFEIGGGAGATLKGKATAEKGVDLTGLVVNFLLSISGEFDWGKISLLDVLSPGATTAISRFPVLDNVVRNAAIALKFEPAVTGSLDFQVYPKYKCEGLTVEGALSLKGVYEPSVGMFESSFYFGGAPRLVLQVPGDLFKELGFKLFSGYEVKWYSWVRSDSVVIVDYSYPASSSMTLSLLGDNVTGYILEDVHNRDATWRPVSRVWRERGGELFVPAIENLSFLALAQEEQRAIPGTLGASAVSDIKLVENVYPQASPSLTANGSDLMLLYVRDNGAANPVQFTEVAWSRFDGNTWSAPAIVAGSAAGAPVYSEGFNDPAAPSGWAIEQSGELDMDFITDSENPGGFTPTEGTRMARVNSYTVESGDVRLKQTVPVDTTTLPSGARALFDWTVDSQYPVYDDHVSLEWSLDGASWHSMGTATRYSYDGDQWTTQSFEIPAGALGQAAVYFSFLVTSEWGNDCHLDNFRLVAEEAGDTSAQFSPCVCYDGNGDAVAVWEQIKDPSFEGNGIEEMAAQLEIVACQWSSGTGTWGTPVPLTDNEAFDHTPVVAGPLSDGDLFLVWQETPTNHFMGTGVPGSPENSRVLTRRWDAATQVWGPAETLVADLTGEISVSFAASGDRAACVITRDLDADLGDSSDAELFYRVWDGLAGTWGALTRHTSDSVFDRNARVCVDDTGDIVALWQRGDDLVMDRNFSGSPSVVRTNTTIFGFSDFSLAAGPAGHLALLWGEMSEQGPDMFYRIYDPASGIWGLDGVLSSDSSLEQALAPVWDAAGQLVLAYVDVDVVDQTVSVEVEGGGTIDVDGVPQPGQADLHILTQIPARDLALSDAGLVISGDSPFPGTTLTLSAVVHNAGDFAENNVKVAFYDGDPAWGGTLIDEVTLPGWLAASGTATAETEWLIPEPVAPHTLFAVVDPDAAVDEIDEDNNWQSVSIGLPDLALEYVGSSVQQDGSVRVVGRVKNCGATFSPVVGLALYADNQSDPLSEVAVPLLSPSESLDIAITLAAGSHSEGESGYSLLLDEFNSNEDIDRENNRVSFTLALLVDADGDGLPRSWEEAHGMSDSDPLDADTDTDLDGFTARKEYLAGTDPRDGDSFLHCGEFNVLQTGDGLQTTCTVSWGSAEGVVYRLERSYDLSLWETVADNLLATPPLNTFEEILNPVPPRVFYRITAR